MDVERPVEPRAQIKERPCNQHPEVQQVTTDKVDNECSKYDRFDKPPFRMQHEGVLPPCIGSFVQLLVGVGVVVANDSGHGLSPAEGWFGGSLCARFACLNGTCSGGQQVALAKTFASPRLFRSRGDWHRLELACGQS
jgi:hypothetical protein